MAGNILYVQLREGTDEKIAMVPNLSAYEVQDQIKAMEGQAVAMDKMLVITTQLADFPKPKPAPEEVEEDGSD